MQTEPRHITRRMRSKTWLPQFDQGADFLVARPFQCSGQKWAVGQTFDKSSVPRRRLKQLYEARALTQIVNGKAATMTADADVLPELTVKHVGRGAYYVVDAAGFRHGEKGTKEQCEALKLRILSDAGIAFRTRRAAQLAG